MMLGPRGSGVKAQAARLEQFYGWRVVDFMQVVQDKLREILAMPTKLPNNIESVDGPPCMISMSQEELDSIKEGKVMPTWKFLPWVLEFLDIPLEARAKPEVQEVEINEEELTPEELVAKKKKDKAAAEAAKKKAKEEEAEMARKSERATKRAQAIEEG